MTTQMQATAHMTIRNDVFGGSFSRRLKAFEDAVKREARDAATKATAETRSAFRAKRPQNVPGRPGRNNSTRMVDALRWEAQSDGTVAFNLTFADHSAPYWIIQEIGTGQRATIRTAGSKNPIGRPAAGATYVRTVSSQIGRLIPGHLAFGTGPSGSYSAPGAATGQQLYLRSRLKGAPATGGLRITKEIDGQRMVAKGGTQGFVQYRNEVRDAARRAFGGRPRP